MRKAAKMLFGKYFGKCFDDNFGRYFDECFGKCFGKYFGKYFGRYFDESLDLHVQSFNLLGFAGMAASAVVTAISVMQGAAAAACICAGAFLLALGLMCVAGRKWSYRLCSWIVVIGVFIVAFPALFFLAGGYRSGMPCFFVFALIYTTIMLAGRERAAALTAEFALYLSCCLAAYLRPETVSHYYESELLYLSDVMTGIVVSGVLLILVVMLHTRMYRIRQMQIDELNRELEARNETLARHSRMKSDVLATVAHEISAPLTAITMSSADTIALLGESPVNMDEIKENNERIANRAILLDRVIMDLKDTAAIETGRLSLSRQLLNLPELLRNVCDTAIKQLDMNANVIAYDILQHAPKLWVDPQRIEQVMMNLLANATRHTKNGRIEIRLTRMGKTQVVSVTDDGEGMEPEVADAVLKRRTTSSKDYWRHGYGLYVCREIILSHGGEIWVDSEKGSGTSVSFKLFEEPGNE
jgi:signal transduction histidine kinase